MKKFLYVILALGVLYIVLALFGKSSIKVERQIAINKPVEVVKPKLTDLKFFHAKWSPWTEKDTAMKKNFYGEPGTVGHKMDWSGNDAVGTGTIEIAAIKEDSIIEKLSFEGMGDSKSYFIVSGKDNSANVIWGIQMDIGFFGRPIMMFMDMDKMMGADFDKGLAYLKKVIEETSEAVAPKYEIKEIEWPESNYAGSKKETVSFQKIPEFFGKYLPAMNGEMEQSKIKPESPPSGIYWSYDMANGAADLSAAFKVQAGAKVKGFENYKFPAGKVLSLAYYGDYQKMMGAYEAMDNYMKEKGLAKTVSIEEYVNDPMSEKDTAKWQTNIYYLLK